MEPGSGAQMADRHAGRIWSGRQTTPREHIERNPHWSKRIGDSTWISTWQVDENSTVRAIIGVRSFHAREWQKGPVHAIVEWKGTCFCRRVLLSSSFFFFLSVFLSFFFSHPDSCLIIKIFVVKNDVLGEAWGGPGGPTGEEKTEKKRKNEKMWKWRKMKKNEKSKKWKNEEKWRKWKK